MRTVIGTTGTGLGPLYYRRAGIGHRYQPGNGAEKKKNSPAARKRDDFLTGRFLPVSSDFLVECPQKGTGMNVTTQEGFDYLYRSAVNYTGLLGLSLPFPQKRRSPYPRLDIIRLYEVMENLLPENINLELVDGRLTFCLYRFHKWPDYQLFWTPLDFTERLNRPLKRIVLEFIRRLARHHRMGDLTDTCYYEIADSYLERYGEESDEFTPKEKKRIGRLIESYRKGRIARLLKRMYGRAFCTDLEERLDAYKPEKKSEKELLELVREGMTLMGKDVPCIMDYQYDWINEEEPDFMPALLETQIALVYSLDDEITEDMENTFSMDMQESYNLTPVTTFFLTPETDRPFEMDDFPERFADWHNRFVFHVTHYFNQKKIR